MTDHKKKIAHLRRDKILRKVIDQVEELERTWITKARPNHFKALVRAIVNQQLSGKAADTIFKRFEELFAKSATVKNSNKKLAKKSPRKKFPTPEDILKMPTAKLRKVGLSGMKVDFLKDLQFLRVARNLFRRRRKVASS